MFSVAPVGQVAVVAACAVAAWSIRTLKVATRMLATRQRRYRGPDSSVRAAANRLRIVSPTRALAIRICVGWTVAYGESYIRLGHAPPLVGQPQSPLVFGGRLSSSALRPADGQRRALAQR